MSSSRVAASSVGRPRDGRIDHAVLAATHAVLAEHGYGRLTVEEVGRRAGTSKPAIYRRWPTRQHLVLAALEQRLGEVQPPDSGCTLCDLNECINVFLDAFERMPPDVLASLLGDCAGRPELRAQFMTSLFAPSRAAVAKTIDRALLRGDLRPDTDRELTLDLLGSFVHYRALFGHATTHPDQIEHAVETILRGIAADYPTLLEHSRQLTGDPGVHESHRSSYPSARE